MANVVGGTVTWTFDVDDKGFKSKTSGVKKEIADIGSGLKKADDQFRETSSQIGKVGISLKNLATGWLAFKAISVAGGFMRSAIDEFNEADIASTNLTNSILNQRGATIENVQSLMAQADALSNVTTFSKEQIMTAQATIATFDGMTTELVQKAIPAFLDYTVKQHGMVTTNEEVKQSAEGYTKAIVGQADVLTKQGFKFTEAQKEILKTGTASERLQVVTEAMAYAQGAAADMADTLAGRQRILENQANNIKESFGGVAQMLKVELLNAFITSAGGMEGWGNNALSISKQVGGAFIKMANIVGQALNGIMALANKAAGAALRLEAGKAIVERAGAGMFWNKPFYSEEDLEAMDQNIIDIGNAQLAVDEKVESYGKSSLEWEKKMGDINDRLQGITKVEDLMAFNTQKSGGGNVNTNNPIGGAGSASKEEADKFSKNMERMTEKVLDFRAKEQETSKKVKESFANERVALDDLRREYEKAVFAIKRSLDELDSKFKSSEASARQSFLGELASSADTARKTIEDRNKEIQTELNNGPNADQNKISALREQNAKEQAILDQNSKLIAEADKIEAEKKTAVGVQNLISRYNEERKIAKQNLEIEKAELRTQLIDKESEYKKSSTKITTDTKTAIAEIQNSYLKMFDDLRNELVKLGTAFVTLLEMGNLVSPTPSKEAQSSLSSLLSGIKKRANGGPIMPNNPYLVGERGPEIIVPNRSGTVIPNGGGNTININVSEKADWQYGVELIKRELGMSGLQAAAGISS